MRTVVLNWPLRILVISCPSRLSLPPERSLRSAHRLSVELPSKTNTCGPMSTRKGQAASVTLLRREQLRSASAPTTAAAGFLPQTALRAASPLLVEGAFVGPVFQPRCFAVMVCTSRAKTATRSTASSGNVQSSFPVFCRMISVRAARLSVCVSRKRTLPCPMTER